MSTLAAGLALAAARTSPPLAAPAGELRVRVERSPKPVAAFIERRAGCNYFLGEDPYDRQRAADIKEALGKLRCASLARDERRLRHAHRGDPTVLKLLDETADALGW